MKRWIDSDAFLTVKRRRKRLKRKEVLARRAMSTPGGGRKRRQPSFPSASLVGWLASAEKGVEKREIGTQCLLKIPETFSVIRNPEEVIRMLAYVADVARSPRKISSLFFDHSRMQVYDLAAEQTLDTVASEIFRTYQTGGQRLRIGGLLPQDEATARFLRAIGIIRHLNISHEYVSPTVEETLEIFVAHRRAAAEEIVFGSQDRKSRETRRFVDHINKCLRRNKRELSSSGVERLATYAGEILANAEEHSGRGEWLLAGYLDNSTSTHMCEIAVLSFGETFAETFMKLDIGSFPMRQVQPYLEAHISKGLFSPKWTMEDLLTVVALQGGISCQNTSELDTRGKGTIDLISFFQQMHDECAAGASTPCEMAILSGRTHILFDGTYRLGRDSTNRDVIAFNPSNSLEDSPDDRFVRHLKYKLPGTAISMRFSLSPEDTTTTSVASMHS